MIEPGQRLVFHSDHNLDTSRSEPPFLQQQILIPLSRTHPCHLVTSLRNEKICEFDGKAWKFIISTDFWESLSLPLHTDLKQSRQSATAESECLSALFWCADGCFTKVFLHLREEGQPFDAPPLPRCTWGSPEPGHIRLAHSCRNFCPLTLTPYPKPLTRTLTGEYPHVLTLTARNGVTGEYITVGIR
jgi:hypothetical protein